MSARNRAHAILAELPAMVWQPSTSSYTPTRIAEIGVHKAELSVVLLEARVDIDMVLIDHWQPTADYPGDRSADYAEAMRNIAPHKDRVHIVQADTVLAANMFGNEHFDLVFVDACHDYESVLSDIKAWRPKVRRGGVLGGHDYYLDSPTKCPGVKQAVDELFPRGFRLRQDATWFVTVHTITSP